MVPAHEITIRAEMAVVGSTNKELVSRERDLSPRVHAPTHEQFDANHKSFASDGTAARLIKQNVEETKRRNVEPCLKLTS